MLNLKEPCQVNFSSIAMHIGIICLLDSENGPLAPVGRNMLETRPSN